MAMAGFLSYGWNAKRPRLPRGGGPGIGGGRGGRRGDALVSRPLTHATSARAPEEHATRTSAHEVRTMRHGRPPVSGRTARIACTAAEHPDHRDDRRWRAARQ